MEEFLNSWYRYE